MAASATTTITMTMGTTLLIALFLNLMPASATTADYLWIGRMKGGCLFGPRAVKTIGRESV